jgi:hypothetical protein
MLKRFFYASASILMLAIAYHLGATTATAQVPGNPIVAAFAWANPYPAVITANGDIYWNSSANPIGGQWVRSINVFTNQGPTAAQQASWGQLKAQYRK